MRNEMPTAEKLRNDVISDTDMDMPTISTRTMQRMLNDLGFLFRKRKRNSALLERDDIVAWRRKYLRTIREMRRQQRTIYYLDETWVNAGHTKETVWTDTKVMSRQDAFRQGLSTGLRAPSGKGGRLIVLHAGSAEGFVDGAALVFRAKKGAGVGPGCGSGGPRSGLARSAHHQEEAQLLVARACLPGRGQHGWPQEQAEAQPALEIPQEQLVAQGSPRTGTSVC
ncbi:hypothetical protein HPB50_005640 [Hyalomma asiaticum]|uniref:Uncharacterized protein n=1 Tax=Hyalomma asiaticum TaxID=266040 RepID=A0ACB7SVW9_HYAAI|nr:hypothetical protein HPB50_005640 [Hyalomma asiaticum]